MMRTSRPFSTSHISSSNQKWMISLVPAIAFGALAVALWREPAPSPILFNNTTISSSVTVVPLSSTFVIASHPATKPLTLRGRLTPYGAKIVPASTAGMVARLLVKPGQVVKAGDTIAMISSQAVPAVEKSRIAVQQRAEDAQVTATQQQNILQRKLAQEKVLLKAANLRVNQAAKRLADSRDMLRRLQNGDKIPKAQITNQDDAATVAPPTPAPQKSHAPSAAALAQAQQEADQTAKAAAQKWQILHDLSTRQLAAKSAAPNSNSNTVPPPTPDQMDSARADAKSAQDAADKARIKAFKLNASTSVATPPKTIKAPPDNSATSTFVTETEATRIANAALQESRDALAQVDAIQKQIRRYQSPVLSATTNYQAATSKLEKAQRSLFDNPPQVPMTPVVANSSGAVQKLVMLATQVNPGDEVATIVTPNLLNLEVRDNNGSWKNLQANAKFKVNVQTSDNAKNVVSTDGRLVSITPPTKAGQPSILHIQVFNPVVKIPTKPTTKNSINVAKPVAQSRVFSPGMIAVCSIAPADTSISIPRTSLHANAKNKYQVAVLKPTGTSQMYTIQWNNISIARDDGSSANVVVSAGLSEGDRIALEPQMLYNVTVAKGSLATVQLS